MNKWEMLKVRDGEQYNLLEEGWEPFSVAVEDTSYYFQSTTVNRRELQPRSTIWVYLRRIKE